MRELTGVTGLTGLTGLSRLAGLANLPVRAILTDDPMRARMLAAHYMENVTVLYELRGMIGYSGSYNGAKIALLSVGYGESAALLYLHDAFLCGVRRVLYMGECISCSPHFKLRDIILAAGGDATLMRYALVAAKQLSLTTTIGNVTTCDRLFLNMSGITGDIADFAAGAVAGFAADYGMAALSVLTVSQNTATREQIEEHERQSRLNAAAQIVFESCALDAKDHVNKKITKNGGDIYGTETL
ncbi:MAG: hypothetical protein FWG43_05675 [Clostridiales bacterium]|nr:hypothetical protein [Clostridiales bacterium]